MKDEDKTKDELKIVSIDEIDNEEKTVEDRDKYTDSVVQFLHEMRLLYLDLMSGEDEVDTETIRASYQFQREVRYALTDCGSKIDVYVHIFLTAIYNPEEAPNGASWYEFFADDDRVSALKILNMLIYEASQFLIEGLNEKE